jgi:DNA polymerase III delta prime subunit
MYRALYRKWRPQRFEDVVAQRGIVTALRNQVASGRVGHAYLFTGVRGTGKTTCAKIFAKAVNCLHPHNGDPCGECEICRGIDNGSILDVVENGREVITVMATLRDETGALQSLLAGISAAGASIVTINQSTPENGAALVAVTIRTDTMQMTPEELTEKLSRQRMVVGVHCGYNL